MTTAVKLLLDLIAIPSINNNFLENNKNLTGESRISDYIKDRAKKAKLEIQKQSTDCGRDNLIIRLLPKGKIKNRLIFCLLYTSPSPRDRQKSRMPSSA